MISINNLTYNGNPVTNLTYDGNPVNVLNVNNIYQWNSSTEFTAKMILVDSDTIGEPVEGTSARINGNCRFLVKVDDTGNLDNMEVSYSPSPNSYTVYRLDDYGFLFDRYIGYDQWGGGSGVYGYNMSINLSKQSITKSFSFDGHIDENNVVFLEGLYSNKTIKVPSVGAYNKILKFQLYPYSFESEFFDSNYIESGNIIKKIRLNNGELIDFSDKYQSVINNTEYHTIKFTNLEDTIFDDFKINLSGIDGNIEYSINSNNSNMFRENFVLLCFIDVSGVHSSIGIHFIQEPHNEFRIYYGPYSSEAAYLDLKYTYVDSGTWNYVFENDNEHLFNMGSNILNNYYELNLSDGQCVVYKKDLTNYYDITFSNPNYVGELKDISCKWDGMTFGYRYISGNTKVIFQKK